MNSPYDLFIFAGEPSADLHGEALIIEIKKRNPNIKILAVAGPKMRALGIDVLMPMEEYQVMGFIDVFLALPKLIKLFYQVAKKILTLSPKAALFIDYPGFNLRMEKHLKKKGFKGKLIHYICPTVWAYGKGRVDLMQKTLNALLCILPFEKNYFDCNKLQVTYVGHPLVDRINCYQYSEISSLKGKKVIAFFPGSRAKEISRNLPIYLQLIEKWEKSFPDLTFAISISLKDHKELIDKIISTHTIDQDRLFFIPSTQSYDLMKKASLSIAKSGTVTLELALHKTPTVVTYAITKLDVFIATKLLGICLPFYALPNIICQKEVFPELFGPFFTLTNLEKKALDLLQKDQRSCCISMCEKIQDILGKDKASEKAAATVIQILQAQ
jgi:lipid-A-disaccharide synthase